MNRHAVRSRSALAVSDGASPVEVEGGFVRVKSTWKNQLISASHCGLTRQASRRVFLQRTAISHVWKGGDQ